MATRHHTTTAKSGPGGGVRVRRGQGTTVTDSSGNGNNGTITNATWTTAGKYGDALVFNGTNALVTITDSTSLHLTTGMTLEAWVNPSAVTSAWRDVIYKGNDNYFLEATSTSGGVPAAGATVGSSDVETLRHGGPGDQYLDVSDGDLRRDDHAALRERDAGGEPGADREHRDFDEPAADRRGQHLRAVFPGMIDEVRVYNVADAGRSRRT